MAAGVDTPAGAAPELVDPQHNEPLLLPPLMCSLPPLYLILCLRTRSKLYRIIAFHMGVEWAPDGGQQADLKASGRPQASGF